MSYFFCLARNLSKYSIYWWPRWEWRWHPKYYLCTNFISLDSWNKNQTVGTLNYPTTLLASKWRIDSDKLKVTKTFDNSKTKSRTLIPFWYTIPNQYVVTKLCLETFLIYSSLPITDLNNKQIKRKVITVCHNILVNL